jgi:hypothetical protein
LNVLASSPLASRAWRVANLYTIVDDKARLIPFQPNWAQRAFYNRLWYCNHVLKARKLGFSTFIEILNLDDVLFNRNFTAGIVDKTMDDAKKKLQMMRCAYDNLDNGDLHPETWKIGREIKRSVRLTTKAKEELAWSNGGKAYCGVSLRGGTINRLHISELGSVAMRTPGKAEEIVNGAMNAFTPGNRCDIESTHEGGRSGTHFRLLNTCMRADPDALTQQDFRFHFFPWWQDPRYVLPVVRPLRPEIADYFDRLEAQLGRTFTPEQKMFYDSKQDIQKHGMKKEFPSTPGEAFEAMSENAIYGKELADLRAGGRIRDIGLYRELPMFTFSDIGLSDYLSTWLIQPCPPHGYLVLDWMEHECLPASGFVDALLLWERKWGKPIAADFLPHDADRRSPNDGKTYAQVLRERQRNVLVVPRTPDVWLGIGHVRDVLPHCWFHAGNCDKPRTHAGEERPGGVACLEGYQKLPAGASGVLREMPKHDEFSHSADGFRTFAEARQRNMIPGGDVRPATPAVKGGPSIRRRR